MDSDTDIYNVWAGLLCKIKPLINRKVINQLQSFNAKMNNCLLYTSPSPRDA